MHNNYYFLRQLATSLNEQWREAVFHSAYSQEKDELILVFEKHGQPLYIKAHLNPSFCCISFPENHFRAKKNSVDLFTDLSGKVLDEVRQFLNERCFSFVFGEWQLLFKLYGNRGNLILWNGIHVVELFRNQLKQDRDLHPAHLDRPIVQTREVFDAEDGEYKKLYPTFGPVIRNFLQQENYSSLSMEEKWSLLQSVVCQLERPDYYVTKSYPFQFSLLPPEGPSDIFQDPVIALNTFFQRHQTAGNLEKEKLVLIGILDNNIRRCEKYIAQNKQKLVELSGETGYREKADLLMAHMHTIENGRSTVTLPDFYHENHPVTIKIKPHLSAQDNATEYYRKAKNQHIHLDTLRKNIEDKQTELTEYHSNRKRIGELEDLKSLRHLKKKQTPVQPADQQSVPYRILEYRGFTIHIGKNARSNDLLLRSSSHKDDLWLHAKDVSGSHVLIRHQPGKGYPPDVRERAAEVAAWFSGRKNDTYVPVIVTPRKYVRKRKGDPPGMVVVDREEEVLLVKAKAISN